MDNLRASLLMTLSMGLFALEDTFIKLMSETIPLGEIMILLGIPGALIYWLMMAYQGIPMLTRTALNPVVLVRTLAEMLTGVCFVTALAMSDLSSVSAILQAMPLLMIVGAALFLGEQVGWRRWMAVIVGFIGMLMIVQPGTAGFDSASLWAVVAVIMLAVRDLVTRRMDPSIPSLQVAVMAFAGFAVVGPVLLIAKQDHMVMPQGVAWLWSLFALIAGMSGYYLIVMATRIGDVSAVVPFRYFRLIAAMFIGVLFLGERPTTLTLCGAAVIVASGLYAFLRETQAKRRAAASMPG